ncbi:FAD/NAD(P)-binding domain-containing protein [Promicromonospora sp. MEB111]|uniref:FAD/NAD(P)-binding protein n=1 Tax=Promicromonospora sp. MEB111 TaxID=3040301 RepID=UPI0025500E31|nr:FAD/NAD(P)-binding domain-containing protein [Promicromonospora sp. MEB111]
MSDASAAPFDAVIVGGGPRAVAVVARLAARRRPDAPWGAAPDETLPVLRVAVVDRVEVGAGATWRTDQSALLLNNTWAARTTVHADASTPMSGPVVAGPDLVDWARTATSDTAWARDEARGLGPGSYPTRRLQGVYYLDQLDEAARRGSIEVVPVHGTVVDVRAAGSGLREVVLAPSPDAAPAGPAAASASAHPAVPSTPTLLTTPVVVLAQGMIQARRSARTERFADAARTHGLVYVEPGMPAERDWAAVPAGEDVLVAGLGANFFDVLALLTVGRGGHFVDAATGAPTDASGRPCDDGGADGPHAGDALRYVPSGNEPHLLAGSRRGLPYRGKGALADGLPEPYPARIATRERFAALAGRAGGRHVLDLARDVWPLMAAELVLAHLTALAEHRPSALRPGLTPDGLAELVERSDDPVRVVAALVVDPADAVDPARADRPPLVAPADWPAWVERWVRDEQESVATPLTSPRARVNQAMETLRGEVARLTRAGVVDGTSLESKGEGVLIPLGLALASGPPPRRTAQLLALVRAGIVELLGEDTRIEVEDGAFVARSRVRDVVRTRALIETRMHRGAVSPTDDPLLRTLLDSGRARRHPLPTAAGGTVPSESLDVTRDGCALVDATGGVDERIIVLGIPAEAVQRGSAIGASPGVPSPLLAGADVAAERILGARRRPAPAAG